MVEKKKSGENGDSREKYIINKESPGIRRGH